MEPPHTVGQADKKRHGSFSPRSPGNAAKRTRITKNIGPDNRTHGRFEAGPDSTASWAKRQMRDQRESGVGRVATRAESEGRWQGRRTVKVLPFPATLATSTLPPWRDTISLT